MSFAGHVFDMIRRNKEDRQRLKDLRTKDNRIKYKSRVPDVSVEELEEVNRLTREKEEQDACYFRRMMFAVIAAFLLILLFLVTIFFTSCSGGKADPPDPEEANRAKAWAYYEEAESVGRSPFVERDSLLKALSLLDSAISLDPENRAFYFLKHNCMLSLGRYAEALQVEKRLEELKPGSPDIRSMVGMNYYLNGDSLSGRRKMLEADSLWSIAMDTVSRENVLLYFTVVASKAFGLKCLEMEDQANAIWEQLIKDPILDEYEEAVIGIDTLFRSYSGKEFLEYMLSEVREREI